MSEKESAENAEEYSDDLTEENMEFASESEVLEEIEEEDEHSRLEKELLEAKNEMLRMRAETENYKKRLAKDKDDAVKFANERIFRDIVPVYDNLIRALEAPDINIKSLKEGVDMIAKQFLSFLEKHHVTPIASVGQPFDPKFHEVVNQVESADHEEDTVIEEYSKGYSLHGRVVIPARVVTSKKPAAENGDASA